MDCNQNKYIWTVYLHTVPKEISAYDHNKYYVGITKRNVKTRWGNNGNAYKPSKSKSGKYCESRFWNAIQKYGWDNIKHEILAEHLTNDEACLMEQLLINILKSSESEYGYNIQRGGYSTSPKNLKKINQYDLNGTYIKTWESVVEAAKSIKRFPTDISAVCKNQRKSAGGFMWKFYDEYSDCTNIDSYNPILLKVGQYDLDGNLIKIWNSIKEASEYLNIKYDNIQIAAFVPNRQTGGYLWVSKYNIQDFEPQISPYIKSTRKKVKQFDMEMNFIRDWDSIRQAEEELNIAGGSITRCCQGKWKNAGNYKWQYA